MPDINRAISELLEPKPKPCDATLDLSVGQAWTRDVSVDEDGCEFVMHPRTWQPRAWDTDETASAFARDILLAELGFSDWTHLVKRKYLELQAAIKDCGQRYRTANRNALYEWLTQRQEKTR